MEQGWQEPIEFSVKARDNKTNLYGLMYVPSFYDENEKYPILNYIYPGPQSGSVGNYSFYVARRDFQSLAEGLSEVGFSSEDIISIMGSNWIRLFEDVFDD